MADDPIIGGYGMPMPIQLPPVDDNQGDPNKNLLVSGIEKGFVDAARGAAGFIGAGARALGATGLAGYFDENAAGLDKVSQAVSRPDLEQQGWTGGGLGGAIKYGLYQAAQMAPLVATFDPAARGLGLVAGGAGELFGAEGLAGRAAAALPPWLGGAQNAVKSAELARDIAVGAGVMGVQGVGEKYNTDAERGPVSQGQAAADILEGFGVGALQSIGPHGATGFARSALAHAGAFAVGSGLQQGIDDANDPNLSLFDRLSRITSSAASGAVMGGVVGGVGSFFHGGKAPGEQTPQVDPTSSTDTLAQAVDAGLSPPPSVGSGIDGLYRQQPQEQQESAQITLPGQPDMLAGWDQGGKAIWQTQADWSHQGFADRVAGILGRETPPDQSGAAPLAEPRNLATLRSLGYMGDDTRQPVQPDIAPFEGNYVDRLVQIANRQGPPDQSGAAPLPPPSNLAELRQRMAAQTAPAVEAQPDQVPPEVQAQLENLNTPDPSIVAAHQMYESVQELRRLNAIPHDDLTDEELDQKIDIRSAMMDHVDISGTPDRRRAYNVDDIMDSFKKATPDQIKEYLGGASNFDDYLNRFDLNKSIAPKVQAQLEAMHTEPAAPRVETQLASIEPDGLKASTATLAKIAAIPTPEQAAAKTAVLQQFGDADGVIPKVGVMRDWLNRTPVQSDVDLYSAMQKELDNGSKVSKTGPFKTMAQQVGLLDENNKPLDLNQARQDAEKNIPNPQARQAELDFLDQVQARRDAVAKAAEPVETRPVAAPSPETRPATAPDLSAGPQSIADRVLQAAHDLTGGTGGEAKIADIRARLPDVAKSDVDNALKQIHADDSDNTLTQAPAGQRKGIDGVSVTGQGKFHNLRVEAPESAPQAASTVLAATDAAVARAAAPLADVSVPASAAAPSAKAVSKKVISVTDAVAKPTTRAGKVVRTALEGDQSNTGTFKSPDGKLVASYEKRSLHDYNSPPVTVREHGGQQRTVGVQNVIEARKIAQAWHNDRSAPVTPRPEIKTPEAQAARRDVAAAREPERPAPEAPRDPTKLTLEKLQPLDRAKLIRDPKGEIIGSYERAGNGFRIRDLDERVVSTGRTIAEVESKGQAWYIKQSGVKDAVQEPRTAGMGDEEQSRAVSENGGGDTVRDSVTGSQSDQGGGEVAQAPAPGGQTGGPRPALETEPNGEMTIDPAAVHGTPQDLVDNLRVPPEEFPPQTDRITPLVREDGGFASDPGSFSKTALRDSFKDLTSNFSEKFRNRIKLIDSPADLPADARSAAERQGLDLTRTPASYWKSNIYLHADQMRNRLDLETAIAHEAFGHMGTAEQLDGRGANFVHVLSQMFDKAGGIDGIRKIAEKYKVWDDKEYGLKQYLKNMDLNNLSIEDKAQIVDELIAHAAQSNAFSRSRRASLAFLGRLKQAIADGLRGIGMHDFADRFEKFGTADVERFLSDSRATLEGRPKENQIDLASLPGNRLEQIIRDNREYLMPIRRKDPSVRDTLEGGSAIMRLLDPINRFLDSHQEIKDKLFRGRTLARGLGLYASDAPTMIRLFDKKYFSGMLNQLHELHNMTESIQATSKLWNKQWTLGMAMMGRSDAKLADAFFKVLQRSSEHEYDPTIAPEKNTHIDPTAKNYAELSQAMFEDHAMWNKWGQQKNGAQDLWRQMQAGVKATQYVHMVNDLHNMVKVYASDAEIRGFETHATKDLIQRTDLTNDPFKTHDYAKAAFEQRMEGLRQYISANRDPADRNIGRLSGEIKRLSEANTRMDRSPYTHLGRQGDFFVSGRINGTDTGVADPTSVAAIQAALAKVGYDHIQLNTTGLNRDLFIRFESEAAANKFHEMMKGELKDHFDTSPEKEGGEPNLPRAGLVTNAEDTLASTLPEALKGVIEHIRNDPKLDQKSKNAAVAELSGLMADALPGNSSAHLQSERMGVQGYSGQVLENQLHSDAVAGNAIARSATALERADIKARIAQVARDAQLDPNLSVSEKGRIQQITDAVLARDNAQDSRIQNAFADKLRLWAHSYFLGLSPAYMTMNLMQPLTLAVPELAKAHGFANSLKAVIGSYGALSKLVTTMVQEQIHAGREYRAGRATNVTAGITERALNRAVANGLDPKLADTLRVQMYRNNLESGTFSHGATEGYDLSAKTSAGAKLLKMASGTATMAELTARLITGIAAHNLYTKGGEKMAEQLKSRGFNDVHDYTSNVIRQSMLEWGGGSTSRLLSKAGPLGAYTPVAGQFHGFAQKLAGKLYSEAHNAFVGDGIDKAESRAYLRSHAAMAMVMSGAMGLPLAGWLAGAVTTASSWFSPGGESFDVNAHIRDFLAQTFGSGMGEVIAHGLPRMANMDFSDLGDRDLLPMQDLLSDRRKFDEAMPDYLSKLWGSALGIGTNVVLAGRDVRDGRYAAAAAHLAPTAMRNLVNAYRISDEGYVNSKGEPMNLKPDALAVLKAALGVKSGDLEETRERQQTLTGLMNDRRDHASLISNMYARAYYANDAEGQQNWLRAAQQYDADPAHYGVPISGDVMRTPAMWQRQMMLGQNAGAGMPYGMKPNDQYAHGLVNY